MKTEIIFEDKDIIVCYKPAGIATQTSGFSQMDVVSELKNYLAKSAKGEPFVGVVQRLDQPVEGVLVFGKNKKATAELSRQLTDKTLKKEYLAAVFTEEEIDNMDHYKDFLLTDYLLKNAKTNLSEVVSSKQKDAKKAELSYTVLKIEKVSNGTVLYIKINLFTGRHHQIRVQMAHAGMPLLGDQKYGTEKSKQLSNDLHVKDVSLCARKVSFKHPVSGKMKEYEIVPKKEIFANVR